MEQIFRVMLSLSISGSLLGLLLLLFRPLTGRVFTRRWTYYLWILVLVRLLVPIHGNVNLMEYLSVNLSAEVLQDNDNGASDTSLSDRMENGNVPHEEAEQGQSTAQVGHGMVQTGGRITLFPVAGAVWVFGVLCMMLKRIYAYRRFVNGVRAARKPVTDDKILRKAAEIQGRLGIGKRVPIYESDAVDSPMLIGFCTPCIYLPSALLAQMHGREDEICLILHHELIHDKRRDIWYKWLFQAALCVHWFNPLVYLFNRKFNVDCELACDEAVMTLLSEEGRRAYGNVLLDVAQQNLNPVMYKNVLTMTLLEEKRTLKERLRGIARYHKKGMVIGLCSTAALILFAVVAVVCGAAENTGSQAAEEGTKLGNFEARVWGQISDSSYDLGDSLRINKKGTPYRMYDDDALIAGESESDTWRAYNYCGGENSVDVSKFALNGSDAMWILHTNKETSLEIDSQFNLRDGRFKIVWVKPDQTVKTLNENGEKNTVKITLPQGRNVIKMVGQEAKLEEIHVVYSGIQKEDFDGIYGDEDMEYAYQVYEGKKPIDVSGLEEAYLYLKTEDESKLTERLLEELQAGGVPEFDSKILVEIAPNMNEKGVSECFRCLLKRGAVSETDWEEIFLYSDTELSAKYLTEALHDGNASGFDDKMLRQICYQVSTKYLTDIVMELDRDGLSFDALIDDVLPFVQKQDEAVACICHYIDLGNVLSNDQLRKIEGYVEEDGFYQVVEYNGKRK